MTSVADNDPDIVLPREIDTRLDVLPRLGENDIVAVEPSGASCAGRCCKGNARLVRPKRPHTCDRLVGSSNGSQKNMTFGRGL